MSNWNWLRLATAVAAGLAGVGCVLLPAAIPYLAPLAAGLAGIAVKTPGFEPSAKE
jgi:hypothetical protein